MTTSAQPARARKGTRAVAALCLALVGGGCASVPKFKPDKIGAAAVRADAGAEAASRPAPVGPYRIHPMDRLSVLVWGRPELGSQMRDEQGRERRVSRVDEDGAITLPFLGRVPVAGRTVLEVTDLLKERYADLAADAEVEVQLVEFRSAWVYVFGEVPRQGTYTIPPRGLSVLEALAAAGGPIPATAKAHTIFLLRSRGDDTANPTIYQLTISELLDGADLDLAAGDRLYVPPTALASWNRTTWALFLLPIVLTIGLILRY